MNIFSLIFQYTLNSAKTKGKFRTRRYSIFVKFQVGFSVPLRITALQNMTRIVCCTFNGFLPRECRYDRLCGLVVRVLGYRSGDPGSIPGTTRKKSSRSGTGSTTEELLDRKVAAPV
jgi:hypothetical protein